MPLTTPAAAAVSAPALGGLASASAASAGAAGTAATDQNRKNAAAQQTVSEAPLSIISVEVIGYGGGSGDERKRDQPGE